jgi:hypothetical protein
MTAQRMVARGRVLSCLNAFAFYGFPGVILRAIGRRDAWRVINRVHARGQSASNASVCQPLVDRHLNISEDVHSPDTSSRAAFKRNG